MRYDANTTTTRTDAHAAMVAELIGTSASTPSRDGVGASTCTQNTHTQTKQNTYSDRLGRAWRWRQRWLGARRLRRGHDRRGSHRRREGLERRHGVRPGRVVWGRQLILVGEFTLRKGRQEDVCIVIQRHREERLAHEAAPPLAIVVPPEALLEALQLGTEHLGKVREGDARVGHAESYGVGWAGVMLEAVCRPRLQGHLQRRVDLARVWSDPRVGGRESIALVGLQRDAQHNLGRLRRPRRRTDRRLLRRAARRLLA
eukprot:scaffold279_cov229-Pinguiococcus_pyrenoidosus.AAC.31